MSMLIDLLVIVAIVWFAYRGWSVGVEAASVAGLELVACLGVAVMLHEAAAGWLLAGFALVLGDWISQAWIILLAFAGLCWGSFALVRLLVHRRTDDGKDDAAEQAEIDPLSDRLAGAVAGGVGGAMFAGGVLVTLSMVPFLAGLKPSGDRMLLDAGKTVLRVAGQFATERPEGTSLPLWGEPPSRITVPTALLTSEPWFDVDDSGSFSEPDRFRDVDGNDTFTKDLYFIDVDGDGVRRVGLIDKYVVGRWDGVLMSNDRPRPDLKKPAPGPAPVPPKGAKPPVTTTTPPREQEPARPAPPAPKPTAPRPAEDKTPDMKPAGPKPADTKPADTKPAPENSEPVPPEGRRPGDDF